MPTHKVTRTAVAFIALIFSGRAVLQDRKAAVAYAYAGTAADFASTKIKLDQGCRETNLLLGTLHGGAAAYNMTVNCK